MIHAMLKPEVLVKPAIAVVGLFVANLPALKEGFQVLAIAATAVYAIFHAVREWRHLKCPAGSQDNCPLLTKTPRGSWLKGVRHLKRPLKLFLIVSLVLFLTSW